MQRILVCDDDGRTVRALRVILRDAGFRVEAVSSANDALDAAALRPPAAAIIELALPDADGVDLCLQLREWSAIPVIVLSAIDEEHHKVRALNAGADDYVTKPFAPRELVARVRAALRRGRPSGPSHAHRVQPARCVAARPRSAADPRVTAPASLGAGPRTRRAVGANAHREPAPQARVAHPHAARRRLPLRGSRAARGSDPRTSPVADTRSGPSCRVGRRP